MSALTWAWGFGVGVVLGGMAGVIVASLLNAAHRDDEK